MGYKVLDLFSGAGGFSLGFKLSGYEIVGSVEMDKDAHNTHKVNFKGSDDILGDITKVSDEVVLNKYGDKGIDVIIAGPSCQSFSNANRNKEDRYSDKAKNRNRLFFEVLRFADLLRPEVIVIENVPQILTSNKGYAKEAIYEYLSDLGYTTNVKVLDSSLYGVPEKRKRAIFVAVKGEGSFDFNLMGEKPVVTTKEAISDLYDLPSESRSYRCDPENDYQRMMRSGVDELQLHIKKNHKDDFVKRVSYVGQGENWRAIPKDKYYGVSLKDGVTHSSKYRRLDENRVSSTITTKIDVLHPLENRLITLREAARLQSFPDWFEFTGGKVSIGKQIGNAVPPLMAKELSLAITKYLER